MIQADRDNPVANGLQFISKNAFDIIRNTLIVATIGYFAERTKSNNLSLIYLISQGMLGIYITSVVAHLRFSENLFSDTKAGQLFGIILSGIIFLCVSLSINYVSGSLVKEAIKAQSNLKQDTGCSFLPR